MLPMKVHRHALFFSAFAAGAVLAGCETDSERLNAGPQPDTTTRLIITNDIRTPLYLRLVPARAQGRHFASVRDAQDRLLERVRNPCLPECPSTQPVACTEEEVSPELVELAPGESFEELWDDTTWSLVQDGQTSCTEQARVPPAPLKVEFCWGYGAVEGELIQEVCSTVEFSPLKGERVEFVVRDEAPANVRFELENQSAQTVLIYLGTGCSSAAGWVQVIDGKENILYRQPDCSICMCGDDCFVCDCAALSPVEFSPGSTKAEEWDGSYYKTVQSSTDPECRAPATAAGDLTARFCVIDTRSSLLSCEDVAFTLGVDRVVRYSYR